MPLLGPSCVRSKLTSPGTVGVGDGRSALHSGDEGRLQIKQVTIQVGDAEEQHKPSREELKKKKEKKNIE